MIKYTLKILTFKFTFNSHLINFQIEKILQVWQRKLIQERRSGKKLGERFPLIHCTSLGFGSLDFTESVFLFLVKQEIHQSLDIHYSICHTEILTSREHYSHHTSNTSIDWWHAKLLKEESHLMMGLQKLYFPVV